MGKHDKSREDEEDPLMSSRDVVPKAQVSRSNLPLFCPSCGNNYVEDAMYCRKCGAKRESGGEDDSINCLTQIIVAAPTASTVPILIMLGMYGNKYFETFGVSIKTIALVTGIARCLAVLLDPLMSWISDCAECSFCGPLCQQLFFGRRRPFMFFGSFVYAILLTCLLNPPYANQNDMETWYGAFMITFFLSATFVLIPFDALGANLSKSSKARKGLYQVANIFEIIGTFIALVLPLAITQVTPDVVTPNDFICRSQPSVVNHCLSGQSCGTFQYEGRHGAFIFNTTLATLLAPVRNHTVRMAGRYCMAAQSALTTNFTTLLGAGTSIEMNEAFCGCLHTCEASCNIARDRTAFTYVGIILATWFVVTTVLLVLWMCMCGDAPAPRKFQPPPFVPALRATLVGNPLFGTFASAWFLDAISTYLWLAMLPYFVQSVVGPEYLTLPRDGIDCFPSVDGSAFGLAGQLSSGHFDWKCRSPNITAACATAAMLGALVGFLCWSHHGRKNNKVKTWRHVSAVTAFSSCLFLCVMRDSAFGGKGNIYFMMIVAFMNGLPLGAKFLGDTILSDIIDYDEFLTGQRREACYFMFKSLIPKLVMIPTTVIPMAFLTTWGYKESWGYVAQRQPESVAAYVKCLVVLGGVGAAAVSWVLKNSFRHLNTDEDLEEVRKGIELHQHGIPWECPVHKKLYMPPRPLEGDDLKMRWAMEHFEVHSFEHMFHIKKKEKDWHKTDHKDLKHGVEELKEKCKWEMAEAFFFFLLCWGGALATLWYTDPKWDFLTVLTVVLMGFAILQLVYFHLRRQAAETIHELVHQKKVSPLAVCHIIHHKAMMNGEVELIEKKEEKEDFSIKKEMEWFMGCSR